VQHFVTVKVIEAENDAHLRELHVLHKLRNELSDVTKRLLNLNIGGGGADIADYLLFPYYTLDLNSFLHYKSDNIVKLAHQAVTAVAALHSVNIMHGDIKPHNFSVRVRQHSHFQVILSNFDYAVTLGEKVHGRPVVAYYPEETDYLKYEHPWVSPEVYRMKTSEGKVLAAASLAIDVFALGLLLGVAVDQDCCQDRNKCLYEHRNIDKVLTSQMDLTMLFRPMRCRDDPLAKKMLVCATNMMCLVDPLQRCRMDDILREINM
jgi:serine/threonine protein kinase